MAATIYYENDADLSHLKAKQLPFWDTVHRGTLKPRTFETVDVRW